MVGNLQVWNHEIFFPDCSCGMEATWMGFKTWVQRKGTEWTTREVNLPCLSPALGIRVLTQYTLLFGTAKHGKTM